VAAHLSAAGVGAPILLALWVWLACAHARGNHAARIVFRVVHVTLTLGVIAVTFAGISASAAIGGAVMTQIQLASVALIFYPSKTPLPYRPRRQLVDPAWR
jgi:hypothetical protein